MRVLLIEDDQEAARLLAKGLREEGWVVDIAHSGEVGDEMASVNTYDAIVLALAAPGSRRHRDLPRPARRRSARPDPDAHRAGCGRRPRAGAECRSR